MSDAQTLSVYEARAAEYAEKTDHDNETDPQLAAFIEACPKGGRVLDLGCGPGMSAAVMAKHGLRVDAADATPAMVRLAAEHSGVNARQATFDDIDEEGVYDGIWASFSLLHAAKRDLPRHLGAVNRALKPGGMICIGMKLGEGEERDELGRHYAYYSTHELDGLLEKAGFTVLDHRFGRSTGLSGAESDWVQVSARA